MKPHLPISPTASSAPFLLAAILAPIARAGTPAADARPPSLTSGIDHSRMYYDALGDGTIWARGESYKMSFDASGATYYPRVGSRATHNLPHRLSPDSITVGGTELALESSAARRTGDRVEIDRGAFVEAYELEIRSAEQLFVFPSLPRGGDLVVHVPVATELEGFVTSEGLEFRGQDGQVKYSRAVAIDAGGRRISAPTSIEDGAIVIRVDAGFLATAAMPLTIDPVVTNVWFDSTGLDTRTPDVAWDTGQGVWLAVYQEFYSVIDNDIFARVVSSSGALLSSGYVDISTQSWNKPRCADLACAQQFLVVAEVSSTSPSSIRGRTVNPSGTFLTFGSPFDIASGGSTNRFAPDVGGDPSASVSNWCVVYEEDFSNFDKRIAYRLVDNTGTLVGSQNGYMTTSAGSPDVTPSIAKSNDTGSWLVAWTRLDQMTNGDIWAGRINANGTIADYSFPVTSDGSFDTAPAASSPIRGTHRAMISFNRGINQGRDTVVAALDGTSVLQVLNVSDTQDPNESVEQIESSIDCDGQHFVVTYSEYDPAFLNYDVFATDLFLAGNTIGIAQPHVILFGLGLWERRSQISAQHLANGTTRRYFAVYEIRENDQDYDTGGQLFDGIEGGGAWPFCFGDGTEGACPCGNSGLTVGHGCANSVNGFGGLLGTSGTASTVHDTLQLNASEMPATATCIFLQGTASIAGVTYGDGIRCTAGSLKRLATKSASGGAASFPTGADPSISVRGAVPGVGGRRFYQTYYRDSLSFCTSATFNITNGMSVQWAP